jgi:uridine kinase
MSQKLIEELARMIYETNQDSPLLVGIDGIDAAGKTFLADEIAAFLTENGHSVIRASIDGFHNSKDTRYQRGEYSADGYYYDSFNYEILKEVLLEPLTPGGNRRIRTSVYDFKTENENQADEMLASDDHILLFEGVFLFRPELIQYWDLKIFVDISFQTSLNRALERDIYLFGEKEEIVKRYQERYIPGQKIYLESEKPQTKADIVIDNNDFTNPMITYRRMPSDI